MRLFAAQARRQTQVARSAGFRLRQAAARDIGKSAVLSTGDMRQNPQRGGESGMTAVGSG